jgi:acyl-CoA synthetase (AMP-forming)/AMP-acid ligase II
MGDETRVGREEVLGLGELVRGVLSIAWRIPSVIAQLGRIKRFRSHTPLSLGAILERNAARYPGRTALLFEDSSYTHDELNGGVNRFAHELASRGVSKGETVHVLLDNRPELLMVLGALAKLGAVASLVNPRQRGEALRHSLSLTPARHHIVGEELRGAFEAAANELPLSDADSLYSLREKGGDPAPDGYIDLTEAARRRPRSNPATTGAVTLGDPYAFVFTSGTTGLPKAAIQTHRRWVSGGLWFGRAVMNLGPDDVFYCPLPFCHTNALHVAWAPAARAGAALAIRRRFSARSFWEDVRRFEATAFIYIGEICRYLMNRPARPDDRGHRIRMIIGNGLRPEIWSAFRERFGIRRVYELYGAAEAPLAFVNLLNLDATAGACLMPFAIVRYDLEAERPIRGAGGFMSRAAAGETGLLLARISESLPFAGYTDRSETERKVLRDVFRKGDAWFDSGDLVLDQGYRHIRFVDRLGDTYRWKGENVSTTEVERVVNSLDQVAESAAYGVLVPGTEGRAGMVAIVPATDPGSFDLSALARALTDGLPPYAVPRFVRLSPALETTATLKIKKSALKREGFDPDRSTGPLFTLLPGNDEYRPLTRRLHREIVEGKHRF